MSLDYDISEVDADVNDDVTWKLCHDLIWLTMTVELGSIRLDNIEEWRFRLAYTEIVSPSSGDETLLDVYTVDVLRTFVGLRTNVARIKRGSFTNKWRKALTRMAERDVRNHPGSISEGLEVDNA